MVRILIKPTLLIAQKTRLALFMAILLVYTDTVKGLLQLK